MKEKRNGQSYLLFDNNYATQCTMFGHLQSTQRRPSHSDMFDKLQSSRLVQLGDVRLSTLRFPVNP